MTLLISLYCMQKFKNILEIYFDKRKCTFHTSNLFIFNSAENWYMGGLFSRQSTTHKQRRKTILYKSEKKQQKFPQIPCKSQTPSSLPLLLHDLLDGRHLAEQQWPQPSSVQHNPQSSLSGWPLLPPSSQIRSYCFVCLWGKVSLFETFLEIL